MGKVRLKSHKTGEVIEVEATPEILTPLMIDPIHGWYQAPLEAPPPPVAATRKQKPEA